MSHKYKIIIILVILLLGFTYIANATPLLGFLEEPIISDGLGSPCLSCWMVV